jgi:serine/threonine-protein kinase RsbW
MADVTGGNSAHTSGMGVVEPEVVRLTIPAGLEFVRIARLTASGVASRLGFDVDEIEDLRVAVDELSSILVESSDGSDLELVFTSRKDGIEMEGQVRFDQVGELAIEDLTKQILAAVVDEYTVETRDGAARFRSFKRLTS